MITQKMISFKVDTSQLEKMDLLLPQIGLNRNKFLNRCVDIALGAIEIQIDIAKSRKKPLTDIPFMQ